jgi:predicted RNA-binding Zn-ribbon protein involved in translation (DUF1610 family)
LDRAENCNSCGIRLHGRGITSFKCPNCGKGLIGRCPQCRDQSVEYTCTECGYKGP